MEGWKTHQRMYTFQPNGVAVLANFSRNFAAYLLPALLKITTAGTCGGSKSKEIEKLVRYEVDMALVLSAGTGFAWCRALKQKLEQAAGNTTKLHKSPTEQLVSSTLRFACHQSNALNMIFTELWMAPLIFIARPLPPISSPMTAKRSRFRRLRKAAKPKRYRATPSSRRTLPGGDEELHHCMRSLRSVLPGGSEMGVHELFSEVESYVICLELQVSILRSLLKY